MKALNTTLPFRHTIFVGLACTCFSLAAYCQETSSSKPTLLHGPAIQGVDVAPTFRAAAFRLEGEDDSSDSGTASTATTNSDHQDGLVKRSIRRIGEDQKHLYRGPFE